MEKIKPSTKLYSFFMSAYDHFNAQLFNKKLPDVILTLQRQSNAMGYFSSNRWGSKKGAELHEIAINPQYFSQYPMIEIFQTIVHEMVHLWQHEYGKPSRTGYHNKEWSDKMISVGLMPSDTGKPGGKKVGQHMNDYPMKDGTFSVSCRKLVSSGVLLPYYDKQVPFSLSLLNVMGNSDEVNEASDILIDEMDELLNTVIPLDNIVYSPPAANRSKTKYVCPDCNLKMWGKPGAYVICGQCEVQLVSES